MIMISKLLGFFCNNNCINFSKKPRIIAGFSVLVKIIFSGGILLHRKSTRDQFNFAFRNIKQIPSTKMNLPKSNHVNPINDELKSNDLEKSSKEQESQPQFQDSLNSKSKDADVSDGSSEELSSLHESSDKPDLYLSLNSMPSFRDYCRQTGEAIIKVNTLPKCHFEEALEKSANLALSLLKYSYYLPCYKEMKEAIAAKNGTASEELLLSQELFKRTFESFMEAKPQLCPSKDIVNVNLGPKTKALFGKTVYKVGEDLAVSAKSKTTYLAQITLLDEGSVNEIYLAADILAGKLRIIRQLKDDVPKNIPTHNVNKMHAELQRIQSLSKRIINMHYCETTSAIVSIAEKGSLRQFIETNPESSAKKAILLEVFAFLRDLHRENYVLGDVKSENILLKIGKKGHLKVKFTDLDAVFKNNSPSTHTYSISYAAPEIFVSRAHTSEYTDRWALGILLYEMKHHLSDADENDVPLFMQEVFSRFKKQEKLQLDHFKNRDEFNLNDPYDQLIVDLLQIIPEQRLSASEALNRLETIPLKNFCVISTKEDNLN